MCTHAVATRAFAASSCVPHVQPWCAACAAVVCRGSSARAAGRCGYANRRRRFNTCRPFHCLSLAFHCLFPLPSNTRVPQFSGFSMTPVESVG